MALIDSAGFIDVKVGDPIDTFEGAHGEVNARQFGVFGHSFIARKP